VRRNGPLNIPQAPLTPSPSLLPTLWPGFEVAVVVEVVLVVEPSTGSAVVVSVVWLPVDKLEAAVDW
jgi:hypothetical protein